MNQEFMNNEENLFFDETATNLNKIINSADVFRCKCESCGNNFIMKSRVQECIICGSNRLTELEYNDNFNSVLVLPFEKDLDFVKKDYKVGTLKNPIIPFAFRKKEVLTSIKRVYLRSKCLGLKVSGEASFLAVDKNSINKKDSQEHKYKVVMNSNFDYDNVLVNGITNVNKKLINEIDDYNLSGLVNFDWNNFENEIAIIDNEVVDKTDKVKDDVLKCSVNVIKDSIKHDSKKLEQNNLDVVINSEKDVLLPIYIARIDYKGKRYFYLVNGSTGKVAADFVIGKLELVLFSIFFFLVVFLIAFLIAYFL